MRKGILILILLFLAGGIIGYRIYNKPHRDVASSKSDVQINAQTLFEAFARDEQSAIADYAEQILCVEGEVDHVDLTNGEEPQLIFKVTDNQGDVRCGFAPSERASLEGVTSGELVTLKGLCKGMNGDASLDLLMEEEVILSDCIVIAECE